jgi:hypothetical protein
LKHNPFVSKSSKELIIVLFEVNRLWHPPGASNHQQEGQKQKSTMSKRHYEKDKGNTGNSKGSASSQHGVDSQPRTYSEDVGSAMRQDALHSPALQTFLAFCFKVSSSAQAFWSRRAEEDLQSHLIPHVQTDSNNNETSVPDNFEEDFLCTDSSEAPRRPI